MQRTEVHAVDHAVALRPAPCAGASVLPLADIFLSAVHFLRSFLTSNLYQPFLSAKKALDAFLEGAEADEAHQALYDIIRAAFLAGWRSAGGDPPQEQKLFELIPGGKPLEPPK